MKKREYRKIPFRQRYTPMERIMIILLSTAAVLCALLSVIQFLRLSSDPAANKTGQDVVVNRKDVLQEQIPQGTVLALTADAGREYTDETLFLGDSNTVRFMQNLDEDGQTYTTVENTIAVIGMGAQAISTLPCMQFDIGTFTMVDAVAILQPRRIILTFGTNNLDGFTTDTSFFIDEYEPQVKAVQEAYPYADIIVQSIFPIAELNEYPNLKVSQIRLFNSAIIQMCERNDWKYLNTFEALFDTHSGFARAGLMDTDGLHLSEQGVREVFRYIRTHAYQTEDRRPQPLEEIPYIIGPKTELYEVNPLNNQAFPPELSGEPEAPAEEVPESTEWEEPEEYTEPEVPAEPEVPEEVPVEEAPPAEGE